MQIFIENMNGNSLWVAIKANQNNLYMKESRGSHGSSSRITNDEREVSGEQAGFSGSGNAIHKTHIVSAD